MENDEVELIDYFRVIWKRKILIIVGTLVCIVIGVVVSWKLSVIYRSEILLRIGRTAERISPSHPSSSSFVFLDTIGNLVETIPIEYPLEEGLEYDFNVEPVKKTSMMKMTLEGPDKRKTKKLLSAVVERIISDHSEMTESSVQFYKVLIEKREADIEEIQDDLVLENLELEEIDKEVEKEMNVLMSKERNVEEDIEGADPFAMMMIQNRSIAIQNSLLRMKESVSNNLSRMKEVSKKNQKQSRFNIKVIRKEIFMYQCIINTIRNNKTRSIGEVLSSTIKPNRKRRIMLAGAAGLMIFLILAFFIESQGSGIRSKSMKR